MTSSPEPADVERFRTIVGERLGLSFDDSRLDYLADVLRQRMDATGYGRFGAYEAKLSDPGRDEVRALAGALTVAETYFFRYWDHFRAFAEVVLPDRARALSGRRRIRVLSAGCASGEEAYSLAILIREHLPAAESWDVKLLGVDVNPAMIEKAAQARYSAWSLRDTSTDLRARYFRADGRTLTLDAAARTMASFQERNLVEDDPAFWHEGAFDVVFCRNVLMYFSQEVMSAVVARISRALSPGGFLFLGHAETLRGVSQDFHLRHTHDTFYYQRRDAAELTPPPAVHSPLGPRPSPAEPLATALDLNDSSWIGAVQRASDRIAQLARIPRAQLRVAPPSFPPGALPAPPDLRPAMDLLQKERFAEAMELLHALPVSSADDPDAQLLRAVLLTNSGQHRDAERACAQLLSADELNAGAHYLVALCREHAGDRSAALEHDQTATYLDPAFAMPHLHLGLLARRGGDRERARVELGQALALLPREDSSRILLFGGGFTRETLLALCRSELHASGGRA